MSAVSAAAGRTEVAPPLRSQARRNGNPSSLAWYLFLIYIILEFDRPPVLSALKLQFIIALGLPLIWLGGKERPWSRVLTAEVAMLLIAASMIPFAINNFSAYFTTRTLFSSVGISIAMAWLFASRDGMRRFYWAWLLVMSWVALFGILHGGRGTGGFLGDENDLALACVATFPFAFYGFQLLGGYQRWVAGGCGFLLVMATVVSISRGGFVGLVAALLYCVLTSAHKLRNMLVGLLLASVFFVSIPQSYVAEIVSIQNTDSGTADTRRFLWLTAWNIWKAHPVVGVGGGNFNHVAGHYTPKGGRWDKPEYQERDYTGTTVHSMYFQTLSELGGAGFLAYGLMLGGHFRGVSRIRKRVRKRKDLSRELKNEIELYGGSLAAGMIGALGAGAFLSAAYYPYTFLFAGAGVALVAWGSRVLAEESASRVSAREAGTGA